MAGVAVHLLLSSFLGFNLFITLNNRFFINTA